MPAAISIDALKVLDAIDRYGSFAAAAQALYRVPSAITYVTRKLEEDLGIQIFEKQGRRMVLTPAGQMLLEHGRQILQATENLTSMVQQVAHGWEAELRIAIDSVLPVQALLPLVAEFQRSHRDTHIKLSYETLSGSWEALEQGRADLVVGANAVEPPNLSIDKQRLGVADFCFVAAPEHPLAAESGILGENQLKAHTSVVLPDSAERLTKLDVCVFAGQRRIEVPDMASKLQAHLAGLGAGNLPRWLAQPYLESGQLVELKTQFRQRPEVFMAWPKAAKGRALHWFRDTVVQQNSLGAYLLQAGSDQAANAQHIDTATEGEN